MSVTERSGKTAPEGFRAVTIESVHQHSDRVDCAIDGPANLIMRHDWLKARGISPTDFTAGRVIYIKGIFGNEMVEIAGYDTLEALVLG